MMKKQEFPESYNGLLSIKSKFMAEFRRTSFPLEETSFDAFFRHISELHSVQDVVLTYTDPVHGDLLPINNDENFCQAKKSCKQAQLMKIYIHKRDNYVVSNGFPGGNSRRRNKKKIEISQPADFRPVSAIIDVDILPATLRRVRLHNPSGDKLLGFYIRDSVRLHVNGEKAEKVPGISIHYLVPGGLAEMTGLLAVDDEIIEVNGIEVMGKSLDQVTDMMVANSANLVITVRPAKSAHLDRSAHPSMRSISPSSKPLPPSTQIPSDDEDDIVEDITASSQIRI